jgi:hypothetical protein
LLGNGSEIMPVARTGTEKAAKVQQRAVDPYIYIYIYIIGGKARRKETTRKTKT